VRRAFVVALAAAALAFALAASCTTEDLCGESPLCGAGGNVATNCEPACTVGPCSNSPTFQDCGDGGSCQIATGDPNSTRFFRSRAVCVVPGSSSCNPDAGPGPSCDGLGNVTGCSAYGRVILAPCSQAGLFFANAECCITGVNPDAGVPDGGDAGP
jgi:hypothetical protein